MQNVGHSSRYRDIREIAHCWARWWVARSPYRNGAITGMILLDVFTGGLSRKDVERELRVISIHQNGRDGSCESGSA